MSILSVSDKIIHLYWWLKSEILSFANIALAKLMIFQLIVILAVLWTLSVTYTYITLAYVPRFMFIYFICDIQGVPPRIYPL